MNAEKSAMGPQIGGAVVAAQHGLNPPLVSAALVVFFASMVTILGQEPASRLDQNGNYTSASIDDRRVASRRSPENASQVADSDWPGC
jgi:hypothetical protein